MRVADFPRPPGDNGLGLNWSSTPHHPKGDMLEPWIAELDSMSIKWVRVLDDGRGSSLELCQKLLVSAIMPIVCFYRDALASSILSKRELATVANMARAGVRYIETNPLPDLNARWSGGVLPKDWQDIVAQTYVRDADAILREGCLPGVPALSPGSSHNLVRSILARGRGDLFEKGAWLAMRNPTGNRPVAFPADEVTRTGRALSRDEYMYYAQWALSGVPYQDLAARGVEISEIDYYKYSNWAWDWRSSAVINELRALNANPAQAVCDDTACFRAWEALSESTVDALGFAVPIITTEGGSIVGADQDRRYPRVNPFMQAAWTLEIARFMRDEAPPWYFACCSSMMAAASLGNPDPVAEQSSWFTTAWDQQFALSGQLPVVQALKDEALGSSSLTGTIRTLAGREISGLVLDLTGEATQPRSFITNDTGDFVFDRLPADSYSLSIRGYGPLEEGITLGDEQSLPLFFWLPTAHLGEISALVLDPQGDPVAGATVSLRRSSSKLADAITDVNGRALFTGLRSGWYQLHSLGTVLAGIAIDGWGRTECPMPVEVTEEFQFAVANQRLLTPEETGDRRLFSGTVTDAKGNPLNGIEIGLFQMVSGSRKHVSSTVTGVDPYRPEGYYEFLHTPGEFQLQVINSQHVCQVATGLLTSGVPGRTEGEPAAYEVNFQQRPLARAVGGSTSLSGRIRGEVKDGHLKLVNPAGELSADIGDHGQFCFAQCEEGIYELRLEGRGVIAVDLAISSEQRHVLDLPLDGSLNGQVSAETVPLLATLRSGTSDWSRTTLVGEQGRFDFDLLAPGVYELEVGDQVITDLWVIGGRPLTMFVLELDGPGHTGVQGRLLTSEGTPAAGVAVELHLDDVRIATQSTLDHGSFAFSGLASGSYALVLPEHGLRLPVVLSMGVSVDIGDTTVQSLRAPKPLERYVLFGSKGDPATRTNVMLALDQILQQGVAAGFSSRQAALADTVLVVGESTVLLPLEEKKLREGGSEVVRVDAEHLAAVMSRLN